MGKREMMNAIHLLLFYTILCYFLQLSLVSAGLISWFQNPEVTLKIYNQLEYHKDLSVTCRSKDDNLGTHHIAYGSFVQWKFRTNFSGTTTIKCHVSWRNPLGVRFSKKLVIFDASLGDDLRCQPNCNWEIKSDGYSFWDGFIGWNSPIGTRISRNKKIPSGTKDT